MRVLVPPRARLSRRTDCLPTTTRSTSMTWAVIAVAAVGFTGFEKQQEPEEVDHEARRAHHQHGVDVLLQVLGRVVDAHETVHGLHDDVQARLVGGRGGLGLVDEDLSKAIEKMKK